MGRYAQFFQCPSLIRIKQKAIYGDSPIFWPHLDLRPVPVCHLCGKSQNSVISFIKLTPICFDNRVIYECQYHGGKPGKFLQNCQTGEDIFVKPERGMICGVLRELCQSIIIKVVIAIRFMKFFCKDWFYYLITRNDFVTNKYCNFLRMKKCLNTNSNNS